MNLGVFYRQLGQRRSAAPGVKVEQALMKEMLKTQASSASDGLERGFNLRLFGGKIIKYSKVVTGRHDSVVIEDNKELWPSVPWVGNFHVHPYELRMGVNTWAGPSPADLNSWLGQAGKAGAPDHVIRLVIGGGCLFLVHIKKQRNKIDAQRYTKTINKFKKILNPANLLFSFFYVDEQGYRASEVALSNARDGVDILPILQKANRFWSRYEDFGNLYSRLTHYLNILSSHLEDFDYYVGNVPRILTNGCTLTLKKFDASSQREIDNWIRKVLRPWTKRYGIWETDVF
jgi:hypothetical protein